MKPKFSRGSSGSARGSERSPSFARRKSPDHPCAQCGGWAYRDDPYCSRRCAELSYGVRSVAADKANRLLSRKIARTERQPWVEIANDHVNAERHAGPTVRRALVR